MNCEQARELLGAGPEAISPDLHTHLESCAHCAAYQQQLRDFEARLRRALQIDPKPLMRGAASALPHPAACADVVPIKRRLPETPGVIAARTPRPKWLAFAASVVGGLLVTFTLWLSRPGPALATEIVTHVEGEPGSWSATQPISAAQLETVLRKSGVQLGAAIGPVVYANSCWFRGHFVPHLVVMTPSGPVTVMILRHEHVRRAAQFAEDGFSGLLAPAAEGSVAILSHPGVPLEQPERSVLRALRPRQ